MYEKIPEELKKLPCWICWRAIPDPKSHSGIKKEPIDPITGKLGSSTDPAKWADFDTAVKASKSFSGIGFVFDGKSGYFGVDVDDIADSVKDFLNGSTDNVAGEFILALQSYTELSQSGNGVHIICKGKLPPEGRKSKVTGVGVEMYEWGRYFVVTGNAVTNYPITERTEEIKPLHAKYIKGAGVKKSVPAQKSAGVPQDTFTGCTDSIAERLEKARLSKQGKLFSDLMDGNFENYYNSHSEADLALCNILAFWLGRDPDAVDSVFRTSGLMRDKWDRKQSGSTYGRLTVQKAISECGAVYGEKNVPSKNYSVTVSADGIPRASDEDGREIKLYTMDDTGNAERMFDNYGGRLRYSYIEKSWYYWDERRWRKDVTGTVDRVADDSLTVMQSETELYRLIDEKNGGKDEMEKKFLRHIKSSRSSKSKTAMKNELRHKVPALPGQFDRDKYALNTLDGIIDLRSGRLVPHDIKKYITKLCGTGLSEADCPVWKGFLDVVFGGDPEMIRYIQKAVGYSLSGSTSEQCVFFLYGTGRNGKSTFLDTVRAMLGDYAANAQPETIMVSPKSAGGARSDIARLKGTRFVTTVEPNEGMRLDEGLIKQLTGGDPVTTRFQYSSEFEFVPEFKIWMATNHKPIIRGTDTGIWRRIHLVPFGVQIPENKVDRSLPLKLRKELPAILKWAVNGYALYKAEGLRLPSAALNAVNDYRREMDVVSAFISACCTVGGGLEQSSTLYAVYCKWASDNNEYKMSHTRFTTELLKKDGIERKRERDAIYFKGLSLQDFYRNQ